jgi:peptidyl-dipeptidase A
MKRILGLFCMAAIIFMPGCEKKSKQQRLEKFIENHLSQVQPLLKEASLSSWQASITGKEEDYDKSSQLQLKIRQIYSDKGDFAFLKKVRESGEITDTLLARQLVKLYNAYLENQVDPALLKKIVELSSKVEKEFNTFRGTIDGQKVTDNQIRDILKEEEDSNKRKAAWEASKQVGQAVARDIIELVKLRNEAARKVGFDNYHTLSLALGEQDVKELDGIFNELYQLTNEPFKRLKAELDEKLAQKYGVQPADIMPWHYHDPFFQEVPQVYNLNLDLYYENKDVKTLAGKFYDGIGLPVDSILAASSLYEQPGKMPHAFCTDIDRLGDIRILCNLKNNEQWMETILHELGHGVYDKYMDYNLPYFLREPAHTFTTEAVAMLFGRLSKDQAWMKDMLNLTDEQKNEIAQVAGKYAQLKQLIFARWVMVMYNFEKALYANPDQDLNTLWWDMVEKYQFVKRPADRNEPDWASKIHFAIAPCYYHNYQLGELLASQLNNIIVTRLLKNPGQSYVGQKQVGDFLKEKVFEPAAEYRWDEMIERATGEKLTPKYFVGQFVK